MMSNLELLENAEEDLDWYSNNYENLQEKFSNKIVAIKEKRVVASANNIKGLLEELKIEVIDESEVLIEVIYPRNEIIIL